MKWGALALVMLYGQLVQAAPKTLIPVETEHTQLVMVAQENGVLQTLYFGAKIADPAP